MDQQATADVSGPGPTKSRRRSNLLTVSLALIAGAALYCWTLTGSGLAEWETSHEAALKKARSGNRNILLAFHMDGCAPCAAMERLVLSTSRVKSALEDFVPLRVDPLRGELARRYGVYATPTYIVADVDGQVLGRREGWVPSREFVAFLKSAVNEHPSQ